ncbi:MAG: hypothetical protein WCF04_10990 [Candidatus Nanopelagicales bacterium]
MAQTAAELFVAGISGGHMWFGAVGATLPTLLAAPTTGWTEAGYLSEDGFATSQDIGTEDLKVWPLLSPARSVVTEQSVELSLALAQWNADTLGLYWGGTWTEDVPSGVKTLTVPNTRSLDLAVIIDATDGDRTYRYIIEQASISGFEEITHKLGEPSLLGFTMKILAADDTYWFKILTDDTAVVVPV